jgi:hypothetical protein
VFLLFLVLVGVGVEGPVKGSCLILVIESTSDCVMKELITYET